MRSSYIRFKLEFQASSSFEKIEEATSKLTLKCIICGCPKIWRERYGGYLELDRRDLGDYLDDPSGLV